jgi:hypothetical protein
MPDTTERSYGFEVPIFTGPAVCSSVDESDLQPINGIPAERLSDIAYELRTYVMDGDFTAKQNDGEQDDGQLQIGTNHEPDMLKHAAEVVQLIADVGVVGHLWCKTHDGIFRYLGEAHGPNEYFAAAEGQQS